MIKAIVTGAGGRMGGRIISLMTADKDIQLAGAVERVGHELVGKDIGERIGLGKTGIIVTDDLAECAKER